MMDGTVYSNVTILRRDATTVVIPTKYGELPLPLASIDRIDGVRPGAPPPVATPVHTPPAAAPTPSVPVSPSATPAVARATPSPTPARQAPATPAARVTPAPVYLDDSQQRLWLYGAGGLAALGLVVYLLSARRARAPQSTVAGEAEAQDFEFLDENHQPVVINSNAEASGIELAKTVLQSALHDRASDVHIEPAGSEHRVRFRIDGLMQGRATFATERGIRLVSALKNLAQIDIAERRKAQDGRFGARGTGREVDFRVATDAVGVRRKARHPHPRPQGGSARPGRPRHDQEMMRAFRADRSIRAAA